MLINGGPIDINDAIEYLESLGAADVLRTIGTAPYRFYFANITSRGRYLYHEIRKKTSEVEQDKERRLPQILICPQCKNRIQEDWDSCPYCEFKLK